MWGRRSVVADWVEAWGAAAWVVAGGLWLSAAVLTGDEPLAEALSGMALGDPAVLLALGGVTVTFLGLLETYPTIAGRTPFLAQGGLAASGLSAAVNPILYAVVILSLRRPEIWALPGAAAFGQLVGFLWMAGTVVYPLGTTLYAAAALRIDGYPAAVGYLFLVPLVAWALFGLTFLTEGAGSEMLGSVIAPLLLAGAFLGIGSLRFRASESTGTI